MLQRYRSEFKGRGFKLFLDERAWFPDCYYNYANTKTAAARPPSGPAYIPMGTASSRTSSTTPAVGMTAKFPPSKTSGKHSWICPLDRN
jgi:hypothetical protein